MARELLALAVLAAALAGCAEPSITACGLLIHAPARPIDEGVRFDVREVAGDPPGVDVLDYRIHNHTAPDRPILYQGNLGVLAAEPTHELRFLDAKNNSLLDVGDAFVVRVHGALVLQLSRGSVLVGSSLACS